MFFRSYKRNSSDRQGRVDIFTTFDQIHADILVVQMFVAFSSSNIIARCKIKMARFHKLNRMRALKLRSRVVFVQLGFHERD